MSPLTEFVKSSPAGFRLTERPAPGQSYKYFVEGKGCVLSVLFEDSINVYFEWLTEDGMPVGYGPEIRYKWWTKQEFARLMMMGVWQPTNEGCVSA